VALTLHTGDLRERITLQRPAPAVLDSHGHSADAWTDAAIVWAAAEPIRGREFMAAGQEQARAEVRFRIRHRTDVMPTWRVLWRGTAYELSAPPIDTGGQRLQLELMATRVAGSGVTA
jgi:SPP1 family predicted phage head-tail adaptor